MKEIFVAVYIALAAVAYPGCVGFFAGKYPKSNIWEQRGFCAAMVIWPLGPLVAPFTTGFFHLGFRW